MKEKERLKIEALCLSSTSELFASMINEDNRGPNFKWENFHLMAKSLCSKIVLSFTEYPEKDRPKLQEYAESYCESLAKSYVTAAGLIN